MQASTHAGEYGDVLKEPIKAFNLIESENGQKRRVCELLEQVGLSERDINKFPHEFFWRAEAKNLYCKVSCI